MIDFFILSFNIYFAENWTSYFFYIEYFEFNHNSGHVF
jgi:hypothetical protein